VSSGRDREKASRISVILPSTSSGFSFDEGDSSVSAMETIYGGRRYVVGAPAFYSLITFRQ